MDVVGPERRYLEAGILSSQVVLYCVYVVRREHKPSLHVRIWNGREETSLKSN